MRDIPIKSLEPWIWHYNWWLIRRCARSNELEGRRNSLQAGLPAWKGNRRKQAMLKALTEERVAAVLSTLAVNLDETPRTQWKNLLHSST